MAARVLLRGQPWIAGAVGLMALAAPDLASDLTGREGASRWRCWRRLNEERLSGAEPFLIEATVMLASDKPS